MKKLSITACMLFAIVFANGQVKEKNNAYGHYANGYYDRAKEAIDKAILHEVTKSDASVWLYRGNIYLQLSASKEYKNLCTNCAEIAYESYFKALELDPKVTVNMNIQNPTMGLKYCADALYEEARVLYNEKKYEEAFTILEKAYKADNSREHIVSLLASAAEVTKRVDVAKSSYSDMLKMKSKDIRAYVQLANIYKSENDTVKAMNTISAGVPIFLGDSMNVDFAAVYSIFLTWAGKTEEATEVMNKALEKYPNNHTLLINYGTEQTNSKNYAEAEKYLKRALDLQPNDFYAIYNLGNCYYNNFVDKKHALEAVQDKLDDDEYKRMKEENAKLLEMARPYLEKAHEIDPKDKGTLLMMKTVYANMGLYDEVKVIDEKLNALGK